MGTETMAGLSGGPDWPVFVVGGILFLMSVILLSGHGAGIVAGYNTLPKEKKVLYDEKKLCRVTGAGLLLLTVFCIAAVLLEDRLPKNYAGYFVAVIIITIVTVIVLQNTVCKKKQES